MPRTHLKWHIPPALIHPYQNCAPPFLRVCVRACIVHVAVKLKSKLLKPSVLLPMGRCLAGIQHLQMIQMSFGKDEHGLREKDIDYKDKQNYN